MLQVSHSQESPLLHSPPAAATDSRDKSAKKRSSSKVSTFNIEILSTPSKAVIALKIYFDMQLPQLNTVNSSVEHRLPFTLLIVLF